MLLLERPYAERRSKSSSSSYSLCTARALTRSSIVLVLSRGHGQSRLNITAGIMCCQFIGLC